jgi:hypothetical protein
MDAKTNEQIDKVLAVVCENGTSLREALTITFSVCAAVAETVLDQVTFKDKAQRAILDYVNLLHDHVKHYEPKPNRN